MPTRGNATRPGSSGRGSRHDTPRLCHVNVLRHIGHRWPIVRLDHAEADLECIGKCADRPLHGAAAADLGVTDLVAGDGPEPLASFLKEREYLPRGVPLMKRIAALPGQVVCRIGRNVTVDTIAMGEALARDRRGRELPVWQGCLRLGASEIFLMNWDVQDSLDGRYFGPIPKNSIVGRAHPLWTDEGGDGRYQWRAPTR